MRQSVLIIALAASLQVGFREVQGDEASGRLVRELSYDDLWFYKGEVEISQNPGDSHLYCADGFCAHGLGRLGTDGGFDYDGTFVHGHIEGHGTASHDLWDYVGGFKDGRFNGEGELTCLDDTRFRGTFSNGYLAGKGDWIALCGGAHAHSHSSENLCPAVGDCYQVEGDIYTTTDNPFGSRR